LFRADWDRGSWDDKSAILQLRVSPDELGRVSRRVPDTCSPILSLIKKN
jgi:hypothetical protein